MYQTDTEKSCAVYPMDNEKFGEFIAQLRKEKHLTDGNGAASRRAV